MKITLLSRKSWMITLLTLLALLAVAAFTTQNISAQSGTATVNTGALNVRSGPTLSNGIVDIVYQGEVLNVFGRNVDSTWLLVRTPSNIDGWVNVDYVVLNVPIGNIPVIGATSTPTATNATTTPTLTPTTTATPTATATAIPVSTGVVNTGALNVRSGPGLQYGALTVIYNGNSVTLVGRNADATWLQIRTGSNVLGWVNAKYITTSINLANLPVTDGSTSTATPGPATAVPPTATPYLGSATINTGSLNVRTGPGLSYAKVTVLDRGTPVTLLGRNTDGSWVLIGGLTQRRQGWVNVKYIATSTNINSLSIASQTGTVLVITGALNVRSEPSALASTLTTVSYGANLTSLGRSADNLWMKVRAPNGQEGWVNASYVTAVSYAPGQGLPNTPSSPSTPPVNPGNTTSLRACANTTCPVTGSVYSGLTVTATGRTADNTWIYVVTSNNQQGWIQSGYVQLGIPLSSLPVLEGAPSG